MNAMIVDFTEDRDAAISFPGRHLVMNWGNYLRFIADARQSGVYDVLRNSRQFVCRECGTFVLPAKGLFWALRYMGCDGYEELKHDLVTIYYVNDEGWTKYLEGGLRHLPYLHDDEGGPLMDDDGNFIILSCEEVVFRFLDNCICSPVIRSMYENQRTRERRQNTGDRRKKERTGSQPGRREGEGAR